MLLQKIHVQRDRPSGMFAIALRKKQRHKGISLGKPVDILSLNQYLTVMRTFIASLLSMACRVGYRKPVSLTLTCHVEVVVTKLFPVTSVAVLRCR